MLRGERFHILPLCIDGKQFEVVGIGFRDRFIANDMSGVALTAKSGCGDVGRSRPDLGRVSAFLQDDEFVVRQSDEIDPLFEMQIGLTGEGFDGGAVHLSIFGFDAAVLAAFEEVCLECDFDPHATSCGVGERLQNWRVGQFVKAAMQAKSGVTGLGDEG